MRSHILEVKLASLLAVGGAALWIGSAGAAPLFSRVPSKSDAIMGQPLFNEAQSEPSDLAPNFHRQGGQLSAQLRRWHRHHRYLTNLPLLRARRWQSDPLRHRGRP